MKIQLTCVTPDDEILKHFRIAYDSLSLEMARFSDLLELFAAKHASYNDDELYFKIIEFHDFITDDFMDFQNDFEDFLDENERGTK